jgi:hypothetical protein
MTLQSCVSTGHRVQSDRCADVDAMVRAPGIEPGSTPYKGRCSTAELHPRMCLSYIHVM